jgi:hypothetical protein
MRRGVSGEPQCVAAGGCATNAAMWFRYSLRERSSRGCVHWITYLVGSHMPRVPTNEKMSANAALLTYGASRP